MIVKLEKLFGFVYRIRKEIGEEKFNFYFCCVICERRALERSFNFIDFFLDKRYNNICFYLYDID